MRALLVASLVLLAACAETPEPAPARGSEIDEFLSRRQVDKLVDVVAEDEDLREVMDDIGRQVGYNIIVEPDVHEKVTVSFRRIPWRRAVLAIAALYHCDVRQGGVWVLSQPAKVHLEVGNKKLGELLELVAAADRTGQIIVGRDVDRKAIPVCAEDGQTVLVEGYLERLAAENGLHVTRFGSVPVVTKMPAGTSVASVVSRIAGVRAWNAPARGWFALLERAAGLRVAHGETPIDIDFSGSVLVDDLAAATAFASRVPWGEKDLRDIPPEQTLPSGRKLHLELQATWWTWELKLALVDGRVLAPGDEVTPGVRIVMVESDQVELAEGDKSYFLKPP